MRSFRPGNFRTRHFRSGNFFSRGLAQSYAAGRAQIRRLNEVNRSLTAGAENNSASKLTDSSGEIAATDTGRKPASTPTFPTADERV